MLFAGSLLSGAHGQLNPYSFHLALDYTIFINPTMIRTVLRHCNLPFNNISANGDGSEGQGRRIPARSTIGLYKADSAHFLMASGGWLFLFQ